MNDQTSNSGVSAAHDPLSPSRPTSASETLARRRLLLKGVTGGVAALAALKPIGAAAQSTVLVCNNGDNKPALCTVSGVHSAAHSFVGVTQIPAAGRGESYWKSADWPGNLNKNAAKFKDLFGGSDNTKLKDYLDATQIRTDRTLQAEYILAYFNGATFYAQSPTATFCFPYDSVAVADFWKKGGQKKLDAQRLFNAITPL